MITPEEMEGAIKDFYGNELKLMKARFDHHTRKFYGMEPEEYQKWLDTQPKVV